MKKLLIGFILGAGLFLGIGVLSSETLFAESLDPIFEETETTESIKTFATTHDIDFFKAAVILKLVDVDDTLDVETLLTYSDEALYDLFTATLPHGPMTDHTVDDATVDLMKALLDTTDLAPGEAMKVALLSEYTEYTVDELLALSEEELTLLFETLKDEGILPAPGSLMREVMGKARKFFEGEDFPGRGHGPMHRSRERFIPEDMIPELDPNVDPETNAPS